MGTKHRLYSAIFILALLLMQNNRLEAQVTIGSDIPPVPGALLDLKERTTTTKGMLLPRVALKNLSELEMGSTIINNENNEYVKHIGLLVFNVSKNEKSAETRLCPGIHIWNGTEWIPAMAYPVWDKKVTVLGIKTELNTMLWHGGTFPFLWPSEYAREDYPLGVVGTVTDNRPGNAPKTYTATRYYAARYDKWEHTEIRTSFSCDPDNPNYKTTTESKKLGSYFDDGVWLSENISATVMPDGTPINQIAGKSNYTDPMYAYPNNSATSGANPAQQGLLYNFAAATNKERIGVTEDQGGYNIEGPIIQGVCPDGWVLPSDREWTDLENGFLWNSSYFSSTPDIIKDGSYTGLIEYDGFVRDKAFHGQPMKSRTAINQKATAGTSFVTSSGNPKTSGGFNALLTGLVTESAIPAQYGVTGFFWSSSTESAIRSYIRAVGYQDTNQGAGDHRRVIRHVMDQRVLLPVRCKRAIDYVITKD